MTDPVSKARALLAAATPGPWTASGADVEGPEWRVASAVDDGHRPCDFDFGEAPWPPFPKDDAALIAAAPDLLARLCDEVERAGSTVAAAVHATRGLEHVTVASDRDLLRRALLALRPRHGEGRLPRRALVRAALGHGAGVSSAICRALGIDPDEVAGARSTERVHPCSDAHDPGDEHTEVTRG